MTPINIGNGALTVTKTNGQVTVALNEKLSVGGGKAAGIVKVTGTGSVVLDGDTALALAWAIVNSHLAPSVAAIAGPVEGVIDAGVDAI